MYTKQTITTTITLFMFAIGIVCVWMIPVWLAGFPYHFTPLISQIKRPSITGQLPDSINLLFTREVLGLLHIINWQDMNTWALVSAISLACAAIALWLTVRRLFSATIAWATMVPFCFMPMYWQIAINTEYYALALMCLMVGLMLFTYLIKTRRRIAVITLGIFYGLTIATTHAFFPLSIWFAIVYLWEYRHKTTRTILDLALFGMATITAFTLPLWPYALEENLTVSERMNRLLPVNNHLLPDEEFYGDNYAAQFLAHEVKTDLQMKAEGRSLLEMLNSSHRRINHNVGNFNILEILGSSTWLLLNASMALFMQEVTGGAFIWLLIIPGIIALWQKDRTRTIELIGVYISMEIILRFGFRYGRHHLMDVGWILALFAGIGTAHLSKAIQKYFNLRYNNIITIGIIILTAFQLAQSSRMLLAKEYVRSSVPKALAAAEAVNNLPLNTVIAIPHNNLRALITHPVILLNPNTINILYEQEKIIDPFQYYNISHIMGFSKEQSEQIKSAVPNITEISISEPMAIELSPVKRYILNIIR